MGWLERGVETINGLMQSHCASLSAEEQRELLMKKLRFELEIQGISELSHVIENNVKILSDGGD